MAADIIDFDSSFESERREESLNRMIGDVLADSFEEIPEANDEFWKPVNSEAAKQSVNMADSRSSPKNTDRKKTQHTDEYPLPVYSVIDNNCCCFDEGINILRRSRSEDVLTKCHIDDRHAYYEPANQNMASPERRTCHSAFSDSLSSVDGNEARERYFLDDKGFKSFFEEYDKKLDLLENRHNAVDDSFSNMQSILIEFEAFVNFIENRDETTSGKNEDSVEGEMTKPSTSVTDDSDENLLTDNDKCADSQQEQCRPSSVTGADLEDDANPHKSRSDSSQEKEEHDDDKCVGTPVFIDQKPSDGIEDGESGDINQGQDENGNDMGKSADSNENGDEETADGEKKEGDSVENAEEGKKSGEETEESEKVDANHNLRSFLMCLHATLHDTFSRFQNFVAEVGETVHLGALATQHSQRMDSWASHVQRLYNALKTDQLKMQEYIEQKERDWAKVRGQLHAELETQGHQVQEVITTLKQQEDVRRRSERSLGKRVSDRLLRKVDQANKSRGQLDQSLVDILQKKRSDQEQAMALDFSRQLKITELKLILLRQQGYIQRLELQNKELDGVLRGVLFDPETEQFSGNYFVRNPVQLGNHVSAVSDVLHCDHAYYLPGKSTDTDMVGAQTFSIGPYNQRLSAETEAVFDPKMLKYMCQETLAGLNADTPERGSGEKVEQGCDPDVMNIYEGVGENEVGDHNNSRNELTKTESTEYSAELNFDQHGKIDLSLI